MSTRGVAAPFLRASAEGFAGLAAGRLVEDHPELAGAGGFEAWRAHLRSQLAELAAAVDAESPERFAAHCAWSRDAFAARSISDAVPTAALRALRDVLEQSLPAAAWAALPAYFDRAREELARRVLPAPSELPGSHAAGQLAVEYVSALMQGDERAAVSLVLDALDTGRLSVRDALEELLVPAQRELGRRWHQGEIGVAEEHFASIVTAKVVARAMARAPRVEPNGRTVVVATVERDAHELAALIVAASFELDGWRSFCIGGNTPIEDLVSFVARFDADLVALGATLDSQRETAARTIAALRTARPGQRVIVGGAAFAGDASLWRRVGADAGVRSAREAVELGRQLVRA